MSPPRRLAIMSPSVPSLQPTSSGGHAMKTGKMLLRLTALLGLLGLSGCYYYGPPPPPVHGPAVVVPAPPPPAAIIVP